MSGLVANELRLEPGGVSVRVGEGRTAEVLRNLCFRISEERPEQWERLAGAIERSFGRGWIRPATLPSAARSPCPSSERGVRFDLTASGRGLQQTMLLLAHLALHPKSVLILDEPDAHLEVIGSGRSTTCWPAPPGGPGARSSPPAIPKCCSSRPPGGTTIVAFVGEAAPGSPTGAARS